MPLDTLSFHNRRHEHSLTHNDENSNAGKTGWQPNGTDLRKNVARDSFFFLLFLVAGDPTYCTKSQFRCNIMLQACHNDTPEHPETDSQVW